MNITIEPEAITERQQTISELRHLLDLLEADDQIPFPHGWGANRWDAVTFFPQNPVDAARIVRAIGGAWSKNDPNKSEYAALNLVMDGLIDRQVEVHLVVSRNGVCEKRVVGKRTETVREEVQPALYVAVEKEVDVIEFDCKSLLSVADQHIVAELEELAR